MQTLHKTYSDEGEMEHEKRWFISVLAAMTVMLSACGSSGGPAASSGSGGEANSGGDQVELRMMWWGDQARADLTNKALELFEQKHPDIKVVGEFSPQDGYFDKLNTQLASGTAPDVFFWEAMWWTTPTRAFCWISNLIKAMS